MRSVRYFAGWLLPAIFFSLPASSVRAQESTELAITVDDLPSHGALPPQTTRADIARNMIHTFKVKGVPSVYGFMNAGKLVDHPENAEVLRLWVDAGFFLGNHTYSHIDLNKSDASVFEEDIAADEPSLRVFMGSREWHWFRYPFVHEGDTSEKRQAVRSYLREHGYKVAEVTLDFQGYAWNDPYCRCVANGDANAIAWLKSSYLSTAAEYISLGQKMAHLVLGRDIKHVLLLHISAFESVMLPALLDQLAQQGFRFVSLEGAQSDPVYQSDPGSRLQRGGTLLETQLEARHLQYPLHAEKPLEKLTSICR